MSAKVNIAIIGATGIVGETFLKILEERNFPVGELYLLASADSVGKRITFDNKSYVVSEAASFDFKQVDLVLMSAGQSVAKALAPRAVEQGAVVIDNSAAFRREPEIPLVIPEINFDSIQATDKLIANPNCSTIQMLVALKPIYDLVGIKRINVATYQAVSGAGQQAMNELVEQTTHVLNACSISPNVLKAQIAFNIIPEIGEREDNGYTREEMKMHWETQKILNDSQIEVNATAVRVPVFYGHSEAIHIETQKAVDLGSLKKALEAAPGISLTDELATPFTHGNDQDEVYIGRLRVHFSNPHHLNLWVVSDNVRKGAALNAIQIAEKMFTK